MQQAGKAKGQPKWRQTNWRQPKWLIIALLLVVAALAATSWFYNQNRPAATAEATPALQTTRVRQGDLTITASGSGNLVPASEVALAFRTGGLVAQVDVQVGDQVEAGQVLARLDDADARGQVTQAEANLKLAELKLAQLTDADPAAIAAAQASLAGAEADRTKLVTSATSAEILAAQENLRSAQEALALLQAGPDPARLAAAEASLTLAEINVRTAQAAYDRVPSVTVQRDGTTIGIGQTKEAADLWQATTAYDKAKAEYDEIAAGAGQDVLAAARAKVAVAQAQLSELRAGPDPDALKAADARLAQSQAQLDTLLDGGSANDVAAANLNVALARNSLENAQRALDNTQLRAPSDGTVLAVSAEAGETVGASPVITVADLSAPQVRFWVEETDLISVAPGNPVKIVFEALPDLVYTGKVTRVEPALVTVDGVQAVQAWASLDPGENPVSLLSGMTAEIEIIAGEAKGALLLPVQALRELSPGAYAVFIVKDTGELEMRPVTVGLRDFASAQILSGLARGDVVSTGTVETNE